MTDAPTPPPQWTYALQLYGRQDIAEACLLLQARCQVDVVVMLHAMYVFSVLGTQLQGETLAAADARIREWREQVTVPLRRLRTALKAGTDGVPRSALDQVREKIKAAEIEAESAEFAALASFNDGLPVGGGRADEQAQTLLNTVISLYAGMRGRPLDQGSQEAIRTLSTSMT